MRMLSIALLILLPVALFGQRDGDKRDVDGQVFSYTKGVWVHTALGTNYGVSDQYAAVYKDSKWQKWYQQGSPTLKKIMDLGPNVVFKYKGDDGQYHTFFIGQSSQIVKKAIAGGAAAITAGLASGVGSGSAAAAATGSKILGLSATTAGIIGGALVAGVVVVENNDDDEETSEIR